MDLRDVLLWKRRAYIRAFDGEPGKVVLADLARFCHAQATVHVDGDTHGTAQLEGRRQVWLRIQKYLSLTEGQINQLREEAE